jgi:hypothetical protein
VFFETTAFILYIRFSKKRIDQLATGKKRNSFGSGSGQQPVGRFSSPRRKKHFQQTTARFLKHSARVLKAMIQRRVIDDIEHRARRASSQIRGSEH